MVAVAAPMAGLEGRPGDDNGQAGKQAGPVEVMGRVDTAAGRPGEAACALQHARGQRRQLERCARQQQQQQQQQGQEQEQGWGPDQGDS